MKVKIKDNCIPIENLISVEDYAKKEGCTRANIYYHIGAGNIKAVKIAGTTFIEVENNSIDNQAFS